MKRTTPHPARVYLLPEVYDFAFSYRDIRREVAVLMQWYRRHSQRKAPRRVLELAAGPGRHAREFARRRCVVSALDSSPAMCRYALEKARAAGVHVKIRRGRMETLDIPGQFDLVLLMLDSASHILSEAAMDKHLRAVVSKLDIGGIYVMELAYDEGMRRTTSRRGWVVRRDADWVRIQWGCPGDHRNVRTAVTRTTIKIEAQVAGKTIKLVEHALHRHWTEKAMDAAVDRCGALKVVAKYGDFQARETFEPHSAWRLIYILTKD